MHIALKTEYSFKECFMPLERIVDYVVDGVVGVADTNNTYAHVPLQKLAAKHGFKPLFGVRLYVVPNENYKGRAYHEQTVFIAKNERGLRELYELVSSAWDQFYYIPRVFPRQVAALSESVITIQAHQVWSRYSDGTGLIRIDNNYYPTPDDKSVYQLMCGAHKRGDGYVYKFNTTTDPQCIDIWRVPTRVRLATEAIAEQCEHIEIPKAHMVKSNKPVTIEALCMKGVTERGIDLDGEYGDRLDREIALIKEKDYVDYFLIVSDIIREAKKTMLVGPARGSSAGSLVCYLLGITEVDPIEHSLIFERFIDVNRFDLPDIDVDFPDRSRGKVIKYMEKTYGTERVAGLSNINTFKPKHAIGEFAKGLGIPPWETDKVKDSIIERSSGDARAQMAILDTFDTTDPGKQFIEEHPKMRIVEKIEGHASHSGKHAAGVIVSTLPLTNYAPVNSRDGVMMLDKKTSTDLDLLKIDILGLKTLSVIEDCCKLVGIDPNSMYDVPLDDPLTYKLINDYRLVGIFQFEGQALQMICKKIEVTKFEEIAAITALARPGALNSGGTARYILNHIGEREPVYYSEVHEGITRDTFGIVVYQEQMMEIARKIGGFSWADTSTLRTAASKSLGDEFFGKFRDKFIEGAKKNGYGADSEQIWTDISSSGSWSFNKSHAVSYGLVSYWTAYLKAHHPLHFACAVLNHSSNRDSQVRFLRELVKKEGANYIPVDPDVSEVGWTTDGHTIIGGLTNIIGIGEKKAKAALAARQGKRNWQPGIFKAFMAAKTPFDEIFPAEKYWGFLYKDYMRHGIEKPMQIIDVHGEGVFSFIGCLIDRNPRDLNEQVFIERRNGVKFDEYTMYLNFVVEDDTDLISCTVSRYDYEELGKDIADNGRVGKDWYLIKGSISDAKWRRIGCTQIINLNKFFGVEVE